MKNLGMIFFLAIAFTFVSNQAQAQAAAKASCQKTCSKVKMTDVHNVETLQCNVSTLLGNDKAEKTTSCQPAECKTPCKKGGSSASAVKLVKNETVTKKANCQKTCNKKVNVTEKAEKVNVTKAVLAKNE